MPPHEDYEGIVVLGVPRSGTTLVRRLLQAHPNIACPPETNLLSAASRFLQEHRFAGGLSVGVIPGLHFGGVAAPLVIDRLREFLFSFLRDIAAQSGKPRWAEKTAVDIFHLDAIERICGDRCRYVCIVRHPLDVVCSLKDLGDKMESLLPELFAYVQRNPAHYEAYAQAWRDGNARLIRFCDEHPDWTIRVRYEDLAADPGSTLNTIFAFLDEPTDVDLVLARAFGPGTSVGLGDWKTYGRNAVSASSVGRHGTLSRWTLERLAPIVNDVMVQLGYAPVPGRPSDAATAARREELSRLVASMTLAKPRRDDDAH
jgi:protein-tyrosine sulfotransferase